MKGVRIFLANGFEDMEALAVCDVLRRGEVDVKLVGVERGTIVSSHGVNVVPDFCLEDLPEEEGAAGEKDVMIFPGGMPGNMNNLMKQAQKCTRLIAAARRHYAEGGSLAAICAAPGLVLSQIALPEGSKFTCFDGFQDPLIAKGCLFTGAPAEKSGRIITGRSAGHAVAFGLEILKVLKGEETVAKVSHSLYLY